MKYRCKVILIFLFAICSTSAVFPQMQTVEKSPITLKTSLQYLLWLPADYQKNKKEKFPLLIFLHGSGEIGNNIELVKKNGPPSFIEQQPDFPFITVSPQLPHGSRWDVTQLQLLLVNILKTYRVDTTRIYLTGLSLGGFGTWDWACAYPKQFAAIAPVCGGGDVQFADELKSTPVWAFHGEDDPVVPARRSIEMTEAVNKEGGSAKLTLYPGVGHDSWVNAYNDKELYKWMLSLTRKPVDKTINR
jgi:predicted peptidase